MSWQQRIDEALSKQLFRNRWRKRYVVEENSTRLIKIENKTYINFSSNDYLGLNQHPLIIDSWKKGMHLMGVGAGSSGHITGFSRFHSDLEKQIAAWLGYSRAILFISGFAVNQAVISLLSKKNDRIIADKLIHASLLDAAIHSPAKLYRFKHNIIENLIFYLQYLCSGETLVVTEGIFSMDGDAAPLNKINQITKKNNSLLLVDDAHGIGIIGDKGRGSCWVHKIKPDLLTISFSKAFGISGAALLCNENIADYFLQFSRHLIYSTSIPPAQAFALKSALSLIQQGEYLRKCLDDNISYFKLGIKSTSWRFLDSNSAIQPIIIGDDNKAKDLSEKLASAGCWVNVIKPPTVPIGTTRLRITLTSVHTFKDIDVLLEVLNEAAN
ncbi:8-amino-7-oxononanoate synthase [Candidatus Pantoea edessiphila]|uniref:8-amino-7-oxononanoate synthase n=1 Tax=Candidatus Pantoea edessiphila TaxID=2044610 RepID=A0A2P5T2E0_9GAMM|nr:8-amino-7-oxononanoate synthase [Candidatus Pantoea edessiphila]PPI88736.1 8-amino-7-oxononanoate synthase [Candidatus Pantoea edessiphila]